MTNYYVTSEELFGDSYLVTNIECSSYNPNIDGTVTVTVTVKDVYGDAVSGQEVLVTASEGNFTAYNGSSITGASSYTGTTNPSGQFTLTYTCSEWGIINFSANNISKQINVTGLKLVQNNSDLYFVYANESTVQIELNIPTSTTIPSTFTAFGGGAKITETKYRPKYVIVFQAYNSENILIAIKPDGTVERRSESGSQINSTIYGSVSYPRRNL